MAQLIQILEPDAAEQERENLSASVGIDLGTTNSLVAISHNGSREVIADESGRVIVPSVVSYPKGKEAVVGDAVGGAETVRSVKRLMGKAANDVVNSMTFNAQALASQQGGGIALDINGESKTPIEISADILRHLKHMAEMSLDNEVSKAVITVPAYFDEAARIATRDAVRMAGMEVLRLINEPTAAALAYGLDKKKDGTYVIYDLGGGTFDVSVLQMQQGIFRVLATGGDAELGGDDLDEVIAKYLVERHSDADSVALVDVLDVARKIKEEHTLEGKKWSLGAIEVSLGQSEREALLRPLVNQTVDIVRSVIEDAGVGMDQIDGMVLVGGSTRLNLIPEALSGAFTTPVLNDIDPDRVVAVGAAIQAEALTVGSDNLLLDVTSLSLGLETMGGLMEVIIPRNTPIPAVVKQQFTTYKDGQTGIKLNTYQGERELVSDCRSLGEFELVGIPPMKAGAVEVDVTFTVDADGLLSVSAEELKSGVKQEVEVNPTYGLSSDEMDGMIRAAMENAQSDITNRLLVESRIEAQQLVDVLEVALEEDGALLSSDETKLINGELEALRECIKNTDRDEIDLQAKKVEEVTGNFIEKRINHALGGYLTGSSVTHIEEHLEDKNA